MTVNIISESEFFPKDHGVHTAYLATVTMAQKKGLKVLVNSLGKADVTHIHTLGPLGLYKLRTSKHVIVSAHVIPESFVGSLKGTQYWLESAKKYLRYFYNHADIVFAVAPKVKEALKELGVTTRIEILPNALAGDKYKKDASLRKIGREKLALSDSVFCLVSVGQVQPRKGVADFINLAKKFPEMKFIWIGGKPFKNLTAGDEETDSLIKDAPANFSIRGPFDYSEMPAIYNAADAFLFPSYQENAPMAPIEAAGCELPLILRDLPEYKPLYEKGYIACNSLEEFEAQVKKIASDKDFYKKHAEESKELAQKFNGDIIGDKMIEYYNSIITP